MFSEKKCMAFAWVQDEDIWSRLARFIQEVYLSMNHEKVEAVTAAIAQGFSPN